MWFASLSFSATDCSVLITALFSAHIGPDDTADASIAGSVAIESRESRRTAGPSAATDCRRASTAVPCAQMRRPSISVTEWLNWVVLAGGRTMADPAGRPGCRDADARADR